MGAPACPAVPRRALPAARAAALPHLLPTLAATTFANALRRAAMPACRINTCAYMFVVCGVTFFLGIFGEQEPLLPLLPAAALRAWPAARAHSSQQACEAGCRECGRRRPPSD
jgi:hypothetical protein